MNSPVFKTSKLSMIAAIRYVAERTRCRDMEASLFILQALCSGDLVALAAFFEFDEIDGKYYYRGLIELNYALWYSYTPSIFLSTAKSFERFFRLPKSEGTWYHSSYWEMPMLEKKNFKICLQKRDANLKAERHLKYNWEEITFWVCRKLYDDGIPQTGGELVRIYQEICRERGLGEPDESTLKPRARRLLGIFKRELDKV